MKPDRFGPPVLMSLGVLTTGMGIYFLFFRHAMLPEDIRFTGVQPQLLPPQMTEWLRLVFRTWGGFIVGFGVLIMAVAIYLITGRPTFLNAGVAASILVAFGRFLASNIALRSDYLWFVSGLFGVAILVTMCSLIYANSALRK